MKKISGVKSVQRKISKEEVIKKLESFLIHIKDENTTGEYFNINLNISGFSK